MSKYKGVTNYLRILLLGFYQNQAAGERVRAGWNRSYSPHCSLATKIRLFLCLGSKVFYCGGSNLTSPSWTSACTVLGRKKTVPQTVPAGHDSNQYCIWFFNYVFRWEVIFTKKVALIQTRGAGVQDRACEWSDNISPWTLWAICWVCITILKGTVAREFF